MQTSAPDVSAIGECCEIDGQTFGLVAPCLAQADILAARLAGTHRAFVWPTAGCASR
jgi:nitrite reductase (NADH) large subunit